MSKFEDLLELAKNVVENAMLLLDEMIEDRGGYQFSHDTPKEMKAEIDLILEAIILGELKSTSISILSEESGSQGVNEESDLKWIVDPLDGTVNFIRSIGLSGISIGLWKGQEPIFGVVGEIPSKNVYWGGPAFGAFLNEESICISDVKDIAHAIVCSGFPSRYDFSSNKFATLIDVFNEFAKTRMLGAASISILQVAKGNAEAYFESDIMIWDIAAALAILIGAGGKFKMSVGRFEHSYDVFVTNSLIPDKFLCSN